MTSVALVHDVLGARAGGERVALALSDLFPDAPIHTLLHEKAATFAGFNHRNVETSWLNHSPWIRRRYRAAVPIAALTFAARQVDADVTICSSSGLSHHVRTTGAKVIYCHTPARWLHDAATYLQGFSAPISVVARAAAPPFRALDRRAMCTADRVLANSRQVAEEIRLVYGVDATVVAPCSTLDLNGPAEPIAGLDPGFVLSPTRPLGYKRLDVLLDAARKLPDRQFVQIGDGPHRIALFADAPANVTSLGAVSDDQLRWAYRNASVVALTCAEDFGLVPLEAAAHGVHTVAPDARGLRDHDTTLLTRYTFGAPDSLAEAIEASPAPSGIHTVSRLGRERFGADIQAVVREFS